MSAPTRTRRQVGPIERAARRIDADGEKRRVLLALAAFADEGRTDPTVTELSRRCRVHRMAVVVKLDKLARDGVIAIQRGDDRRREKTTYSFLITQPKREDTTMTTETTAPEGAKDALLFPTRPPRWQTETIWPEAPAGPWEWDAAVAIRGVHTDRLTALEDARESGDAGAVRAALVDLCDSIVEALEALRLSIPDAEAAFAAARKDAIPTYPDNVIPDSKRGEYSAAVKAAREWTEPDGKALARARRVVEADTFWPPEGDRIVSTLEADVRAAREAIAR